MKNLSRLSRICTLLAAAPLALAIVPRTLHAQSASPTSTSAGSGKEAALSPVEQKYLQGVAKDNLGEIAVAYLAIEKASNDAVKRHARELIDTHTRTMKELMEIASRHDLFLALEPELSSYRKLRSQGGAEFDRAYAAEAQRLNQKAIDTLNPLLSQLTASDVKDFAQGDLKDDKEHLKGAQELASRLKG